jgi:hypothetical protein
MNCVICVVSALHLCSPGYEVYAVGLSVKLGACCVRASQLYLTTNTIHWCEWSSLGSLLFIVYPRWCDLAPGRAFSLNPEQQVSVRERHCYNCADETGTLALITRLVLRCSLPHPLSLLGWIEGCPKETENDSLNSDNLSYSAEQILSGAADCVMMET